MDILIGQWFELAVVFIRKLISLNLTVEQVKDLIQNKNHPFWIAFETARQTLVVPSVPALVATVTSGDSAEQIGSWVLFYEKRFGINLDMTGMKIPDKVAGFNRLIIITHGISINQVYETGKKLFSSWKWCSGDIESEMRKSERGKVVATYAIWVRDERESDKDLLGRPAEDIENPENTEDVLERLVHGFKYWDETKEHLDKKTCTLCVSSRYSDGDVPSVNRSGGGRVSVRRWHPQRRYAPVGARRAVR
jgi:hypothetical protein